jgi:choline dehydrogenase-like flavoprotein
MDTTTLPDYVATAVIGAGTSGCSFTHIHAVNSGDCLLPLEAGPDYGARSSARWPADILDAKSIPLSHDWHLTGHGSAGSVRGLPRARIVGGCSAHNGCTVARSARTDYDRWAEHLLDHALIQMHFDGKNGLLDGLARTEWNPDEQSIGGAQSSRCDDGPYDADASVMPTITRGNINLPIAMIGAHIAARLLSVALVDVIGVSQLPSAIERSIP